MLLGIWLAFSFHFIAYDWIFNHTQALIDDNVFINENRQKLFLLETFGTITLLAVLMAFQIVNYLFASKNFEAPAEWVA